MFGIGHWEIFVILLVILLVFGAKRIPDMAQGLGRGIREFRKAMREVQDEIDMSGTSAPPRQIAQTMPPAQSVPQQATAGPQPEKNGAEKSQA